MSISVFHSGLATAFQDSGMKIKKTKKNYGTEKKEVVIQGQIKRFRFLSFHKMKNLGALVIYSFWTVRKSTMRYLLKDDVILPESNVK